MRISPISNYKHSNTKSQLNKITNKVKLLNLLLKKIIWNLIINLPISLLGDWNISMFALEMIWINSPKNNFTSFFVLCISVKPKWENRFLNCPLLNHVVPLTLYSSVFISWKQTVINKSHAKAIYLPYWDSITNRDLLESEAKNSIELCHHKCSTGLTGCFNKFLVMFMIKDEFNCSTTIYFGNKFIIITDYLILHNNVTDLDIVFTEEASYRARTIVNLSWFTCIMIAKEMYILLFFYMNKYMFLFRFRLYSWWNRNKFPGNLVFKHLKLLSPLNPESHSALRGKKIYKS